VVSKFGGITKMERIFNQQNKNRLNIVLPKGSLQLNTLKLFQMAGYEITGYNITDRSYTPEVRNDEHLAVKVSRPQEIPIHVEEGAYDIGITGLDWVKETEADVEQVLDLKYGWIEIIMAVPNGGGNSIWNEINSFETLMNLPKEEIRISTEYLNISSKYILEKIGVEPTIITPWKFLRRERGSVSNITLILSFGATEGKPPDEADAIIDNATSSRRTLTANNLKVIESLGESTAILIANTKSLKDPWKKEKIEEVKQALEKGLSRNKRGTLAAHL
jgi:ATP phosphoribosyltransferase